MPAETRLFLCLKDNYGVLLHDPDTGATASIDAPEAGPVEEALKATGWKLTDILVTHHHHDHVGGVAELKQKYGCRVVAPHDKKAQIANVDLRVANGDVVKVGKLLGRVVETPGHTLDHISYVFDSEKAVFAADTLFSIGCGRVFEGTHPMMWESLLKLRTLPDAARTRYATAWQNIQSQFIDDPRGAVTEADARFTDLLSDIGFPSDYDERLSTLSVEHANVLKHYREAHDIAVNVESASTEQLRQALVHYRVLFPELIGKDHFAEDPTLAHAPTPGTGMPGGTGSSVPDRPEGTATLEDGTRGSRRTS